MELGLQIGSKLDVKDTVDKWCEATVVAVDREAAKVYVTYTYWAPKWNEWISIDSPRLAPAGTMTYQEGGPLRVGHRVEVLDEADQWLEADVVEEAEDGRGQVHFKNFSKKYDTWVSPRGGRVRQFGPKGGDTIDRLNRVIRAKNATIQEKTKEVERYKALVDDFSNESTVTSQKIDQLAHDLAVEKRNHEAARQSLEAKIYEAEAARRSLEEQSASLQEKTREVEQHSLRLAELERASAAVHDENLELSRRIQEIHRLAASYAAIIHPSQ